MGSFTKTLIFIISLSVILISTEAISVSLTCGIKLIVSPTLTADKWIKNPLKYIAVKIYILLVNAILLKPKPYVIYLLDSILFQSPLACIKI